MNKLLGANTDTLDRMAESLGGDAKELQDIRSQAQQVVAELQAAWNGPDQWRLTRQWEQQGIPGLASASTSLDTCASRLRAQSSAQRSASRSDCDSSNADPTWLAPAAALGLPVLAGRGSSTPTGPPTPTTDAGSAPERGSPGENASWWKSLSALEQQRLIKEHPESIGNRDGVPFTARDEANRALLDVDRERLVAQQERLNARLSASWFGAPSPTMTLRWPMSRTSWPPWTRSTRHWPETMTASSSCWTCLRNGQRQPSRGGTSTPQTTSPSSFWG
jgi:uncharacterized protein YukE